MPNDQKICPFMSKAESPVFCTEQCKLYSNNRQGDECHFQEMQAISWNTKNQGGGAPSGNQYP